MTGTVFIITMSFPPVANRESLTALKHAILFSKMGFNVKVIAPVQEGASEIFELGLERAIPSGVVVERVSKSLYGTIFSRFLNRTFQGMPGEILVPAVDMKKRLLHLLEERKENRNVTDILFSCSPSFSTHIVASCIKERYPDLFWLVRWTEPPERHIQSKTGAAELKKLMEIERKCFTSGDRILFPAEELLNLYTRKYRSSAGKMSVLKYFYTDSLSSDLLPDFRFDENFINISHIGAVSSLTALRHLVASLREMRAYSRKILSALRFHFIGNPVPDFVEQYIPEDLRHLFRQHDQFSYLEGISLIKKSNFLLHLGSDDTNGDVAGHPRVADLLAAKRPVIAFISERGAVRRILAQTGNFILWGVCGAALEAILSKKIEWKPRNYMLYNEAAAIMSLKRALSSPENLKKPSLPSEDFSLSDRPSGGQEIGLA